MSKEGDVDGSEEQFIEGRDEVPLGLRLGRRYLNRCGVWMNRNHLAHQGWMQVRRTSDSPFLHPSQKAATTNSSTFPNIVERLRHSNGGLVGAFNIVLTSSTDLLRTQSHDSEGVPPSVLSRNCEVCVFVKRQVPADSRVDVHFGVRNNLKIPKSGAVPLCVATNSSLTHPTISPCEYELEQKRFARSEMI